MTSMTNTHGTGSPESEGSTATPGKFGRRSPKQAPALRFARLLTGVVPPHPERVDYGASLNDWQMLGNDEAGDCAAVAWANERHAVTATLSTPTYPTQDMVWTVYRSQNPGFVPHSGPHGFGSADDAGMDMQTLQEYLHTTGGADGVKSVAFAKVDATDADEVDAAIAIFGGVSWGVLVSKANEQAFSRHAPWDAVHGSPIVGGHAIYGLGYGAGDERFITWGAETEFTDAFRHQQAEEAWVTIWPEHLGSKAFQDGINLDTLKADYQALTGDVLDIPSGDDPDQTLWDSTRHFRTAHHGHADQQVADALNAWGAARGLH